MYNKISIKALRKSLGKTQDEFAMDFGISRTTYATWEQRNDFPAEIVDQIARKYSQELQELSELSTSPDSVLREHEPRYYATNKAMAKRIDELEQLIAQKDSLIKNQLSIIELQNQTIQALKNKV